MIPEYERYHGIVLRSLIVESSVPITIQSADSFGWVNCFQLNDRVGLFVKHSSKRLAPWQFTFNSDALEEIASLERTSQSVWLTLVCGFDGIIGLSLDEFRTLTTAEGEPSAFVRVTRDRNTMYRVFGNSGKLASAKPRGLAAVLAAAIEEVSAPGSSDDQKASTDSGWFERVLRMGRR